MSNLKTRNCDCSESRVLSARMRVLTEEGSTHISTPEKESWGSHRSRVGPSSSGTSGRWGLPHSFCFLLLCVCVCARARMLFDLFSVLLNTAKNTETNTLAPVPLPSTLLRMAICSHNRQRQKRVGMNTPKATRIGNMRLLLSEA